MHLCRRQVQFIPVMVAGRYNAAQDVAHLGFVVDQLQQGLAARACLADAEDVLGCRIERNDQQVDVEQNDAGTQVIENMAGSFAQPPAAPGTGVARLMIRRRFV